MKNQNLVVKKSRNGKGIFANKNFQPKQVIYQVTGHIRTSDQLADRGEVVVCNAFRYGPEVYLSPEGSMADYQNHSCEPNAGVIKRGRKLFIIAIEPIPSGREILIDYSTIQGNDDVWWLRCNCGTKSCRKIIKKIGSVPKATQEKYFKLGIVPAYIRATM
jgi:Mg2+ and Co2+ transporter CorA